MTNLTLSKEAIKKMIDSINGSFIFLSQVRDNLYNEQIKYSRALEIKELLDNIYDNLTYIRKVIGCVPYDSLTKVPNLL